MKKKIKKTAKAIYYPNTGNLDILNYNEKELAMIEVLMSKIYGNKARIIDVVITEK